MKPMIKTYLMDEDGQAFFGYGPMLLLKEVERTGSLNQAAKNMGMAYSKAFSMVKRAEKAAGFPMLERSIGGAGGGGSSVTAQGLELMGQYERYREACCREADRLYEEMFGTGE